MKKLLFLVLIFCSNIISAQTEHKPTQQIIHQEEFKKSRHGDKDYDFYIGKYPNEIVVTFDFERSGFVETSIIDIYGNFIFTKSVSKDRVHIKKTQLNGEKTFYILVRSKNYIIKQKYEF